MDDLVTWLRIQLDEDAWWAREASRPDWGEDVMYTEGGEHWRWADETTDEVVAIDPTAGELVADGAVRIYLGSEERYPSRALGPDVTLLHIVLGGCEEVSVAGHIARWDPAHVLAEVGAKRRILDEFEAADAAAEFPNLDGGRAEGLGRAVRLLALSYADRPGYREEWRP